MGRLFVNSLMTHVLPVDQSLKLSLHAFSNPPHPKKKKLKAHFREKDVFMALNIVGHVVNTVSVYEMNVLLWIQYIYDVTDNIFNEISSMKYAVSA